MVWTSGTARPTAGAPIATTWAGHTNRVALIRSKRREVAQQHGVAPDHYQPQGFRFQMTDDAIADDTFALVIPLHPVPPSKSTQRGLEPKA